VALSPIPPPTLTMKKWLWPHHHQKHPPLVSILVSLKNWRREWPHPLSGTYTNPNCDLVPSEFITDPDCSSFSIYLSGIQGQVFGGVIRGKVTASSVVLVTANLLKPKFYRMASVNGSIPNVETLDLMHGGVNSSQLNHQVLYGSPANMNDNQWNHSTSNSNH